MSSVARRHAEWLSLLEINGPFLSMPVLLKAFPQGLDAHDPDHAQLLRTYYGEWLENKESHRPDPSIQRAWIDFILKETLGFTDEVLRTGQRIPEALSVFVAIENETLRPDLVLVNPAGSAEAFTQRLLIQILPFSQGVEKSMESRRWKASPASRMLELLKATKTRVGLVTNGEQWMLVNAPQGESTGYITWTANLWVDEPTTLQAIRSLLCLRRFFGVEDSQTIESLLNESLADQQEVTDQLGYQVRKAVEVFIQAFDRIDQDRNRELLRGVSPTFLYEAALTVMMRLVFLLSAEERGLFMLGEEMYDQHYAVSTLRAQLRETADQQGEEVLSRRSDAWCRLLATFRAVYGGVEHDSLRLPAYGGNLFDPDRFTFLEGRAAGTSWRETPSDPLAINNQIVLHLLEALQILRIKVPGGPPEPRRLSFSTLGVEQIGHVYEGLLDHTAVRASSPVLGLIGSKNQEAEIELSELERFKEIGEAELLEKLKKTTGRQTSTLKRALNFVADEAQLSAQVEGQRLLQACNNDSELCGRVEPFSKILRQDTMDFPVVISAGSLYVTKGSERRASGTYYTPPSLTEPIVKHALDPLVYVGPAEGLPEAEWKLKSAKEILDLKVCDMAMGSGAFLVQVCRYLAEKLVEAWEDAETRNSGTFIVTPDGELSTASDAERLLPVDADERTIIARRYVSDRCLYGVDKNELAVNMAKLSLWLVTLQRDRPFTFLDHALKCGDSLLGVTSLQQIENFSLRPGEQQITFATANLFRYVEQASKKRREIEGLPSNTHAQIETKNRLHAEAEAATVKVKALADCLIAFELLGLDGDAYEQQRTHEAEQIQRLMRRDADAGVETTNLKSELARAARGSLGGRSTFHWALEFPEVFQGRRFDAVVGNPPYLGAPKLTGTFGDDYRDFLIAHLARDVKGLADLCAYFVLRTDSLMSAQAFCGLVVTSAIAEGDTRTVGLQQLADRGWEVVRATSRAPWPGTASVTYSSIWLSPRKWEGTFFLNDEIVPGITPMLTMKQSISGPPHRLRANLERSFNGVKVYGDGFVLTPEEAQALLKADPSNTSVLFPYITTKDVNSHPTHEPSAWAIRFFDWPLDRESAPRDYSGHVANDFPDCLAIVEARVKPERTRRHENGDFVVRDPMPRLWWIYGEKRPGLYAAISSLQHVLAVGTQATKYVAFAVLNKAMVFSHSLSIIANDSFECFAVLHSSLHEVWARHYGGYNLALLRYSPTDLFETFPFPPQFENLEVIGFNYYEHRRKVMLTRQEGLTDTYNRLHDRGEQSADIARLRELQVEMDQAVAAAYGWSEPDLGHGFHETKQGVRFTLCESARREVLDRLLQLNHERHAEEVRLGLYDKNRGKVKRKEKSLAGANAADGKLLKPPLFE